MAWEYGKESPPGAIPDNVPDQAAQQGGFFVAAELVPDDLTLGEHSNVVDHDCILPAAALQSRTLRRSVVALLMLTGGVTPLVVFLSSKHFGARPTWVWVVAGASASLAVFSAICVRNMLHDQFTVQSPPIEIWTNRSRRLRQTLTFGVIALNGCLIPVLPLIAIAGLVVLLVVWSTTIWVICDREGCFHSSGSSPRPTSIMARLTRDELVTICQIILGAWLVLAILLGTTLRLPASQTVSSSSATSTTQPVQSTPTTLVPPSTSTSQPAPTKPAIPTPSTSIPTPCSSWAGKGADDPTATWMNQAGRRGSSSSWGCIGPALDIGHSGWIQGFQYTSAFLLGSSLGAGVVDDAYSSAIKSTLGTTPISLKSLGGQPQNSFTCGGGIGDYLAIVGVGHVVQQLWGRSTTTWTDSLGQRHVTIPIRVAASLLGTVWSELQKGNVLTPYSEASGTGKNLVQEFVDPSSPSETQVFLHPSGIPPPSFTVSNLFAACGPGATIPADLVEPAP